MRRILVMRLDRLGDVVLSTPVLDALRARDPEAFLAMMVQPACRDVVEGHPALDAVIVYDKAAAHRGWWRTVRFAWALRRRAFDVALILHPTRRSHAIAWLAGIPVRIGYARKSGWLLTHRLPHRKQEGKRHEAAYTLELLRPLGIEPPPDPRPSVAVRADAAQRLEALLASHGIGPGEPLIVIHPSASCVSKRWMPERFALVADRLIASTGSRVILVSGAPEQPDAQAVRQAMTRPAVNLAGALSVAELAALLRRARVLISNDSGPVHVAAAVGTPVVAIFGRNQPGLSQQRWGPIGPGHVVLQKDVGCVTCLAHRCDIAFRCLQALSVDDVYAAARAVLDRVTPAGSGT